MITGFVCLSALHDGTFVYYICIGASLWALCRMIDSRVCVEWEIVIEFDYSRVVKFFVDSVLSTGVSEKTKHLGKHFKWDSFDFIDQKISNHVKEKRAGVVRRGSDSLVVVLLLLLPPVLVELMDFNGHIPLLCQIKSLQKKILHTVCKASPPEVIEEIPNIVQRLQTGTHKAN